MSVPEKMRAVVVHDGEFSVEDVVTPQPAAGQVLLKVLRAGICGSDLHVRHHADELADVVAEMGYETAIRPDQHVVLGHEFVGEVVSYGSGTRRQWKPGTRVVALPVIRTDGVIHMTGFDEASPGAYADYVVAQEAFAFPVPDEVSDDLAAFTEPLAVAWHAVRRGHVAKGQTAVVIGAGPIGLAVIMMLKAAGVRTVVASDLSPARRDLARVCGADVVVDPREQSPWEAYKVPRPVRTLPDYLGFGITAMEKLRPVPLLPWQRLMRVADVLGQSPSGPVVFECVGVPGIIEQVLTAAPLHTRVVVVGVCMEPDTIRPSVALQKEIDLRFVFGYDPGEFIETLQMIASGKVDPRPLHTGTIGLEGLAAAFDALAGAGRHAKILVDPASTVATV